MKTAYSAKWKSSSQTRKQRKYVANAPDHIKSKMLASHLSKELSKKYNQRSVRVRVGDRVKILRGQFKGKLAKIEEVDVKIQKLFLEKITISKRDGSNARYPVHPSNVLVMELNLTDKQRKAKLTKTTATSANTKVEAEEKKSAPAEKKETKNQENK